MPGAASSSPPFIPPFRVVKASGGDDYAQLQAVGDACGTDGKEMILVGSLRTSAGVLYRPPAGLKIRGSNPGGFGRSYGGNMKCSLEPFSSAADGLTLMKVDAPTGGVAGGKVTISDFEIKGRYIGDSAGVAGANTIVQKTAGYGLEIGGTLGTVVERMVFSDQYDSVATTGGDALGSQLVKISTCLIYDVVRSGIRLAGSAGVRIQDIDAYNHGGTYPAGSKFIWHETRDDVKIRGAECVNFAWGFLSKQPSVSATVPSGVVLVSDCLFDTGGIGAEINGTIVANGLWMMQRCWFSYNVNQGILITSGTQGIVIDSCLVQSNQGGGIDFTGGSNHKIVNSFIGTNAGFGVRLASGVSRIHIRGNSISDSTWNYGGTISSQTYGIVLGGSHTHLLIKDNDLTGNITGAINGSIAGAMNVVAHNDGLNPKGNIAAPAMPSSTVAYTNTLGYDCMVCITGGTVSVIKVGGVATGFTSTDKMVRVPVGQSIELTYSSAPTWTWFGD